MTTDKGLLRDLAASERANKRLKGKIEELREEIRQNRIVMKKAIAAISALEKGSHQ